MVHDGDLSEGRAVVRYAGTHARWRVINWDGPADIIMYHRHFGGERITVTAERFRPPREDSRGRKKNLTGTRTHHTCPPLARSPIANNGRAVSVERFPEEPIRVRIRRRTHSVVRSAARRGADNNVFSLPHSRSLLSLFDYVSTRKTCCSGRPRDPSPGYHSP